MNIININSRYEITPWQIAFTETLLRFDKESFMSGNSIYNLSQIIPFYLVDIYTFSLIKNGNYNINSHLEDEVSRHKLEKEHKKMKPKYNKYDDVYCPETEVYGYYVSKGTHNIAEIYLCPESIFNHTRNNEELTYLLAKVIIHELAHALMDKRDYGQKDEFYKWMEEASANEITLEYFKKFEENNYNRANSYLRHNNTKSPYDFIREFILSQPDNYKLGYFLHKNYINQYMWWAINKDEIKQKTKAKADWLDYVKSNIKNGSFDRNTLDELTHKVLLDDPYNEMPKK